MWWAQIETSGNQAFIFASNRLRENVGASQLVKAVCTTWVDEAVAGVSDVETLISTSGRALLRSQSKDSLKAVVREVTGRALREAPGLTVTGAIAEESNIPEASDTTLSAVIRHLSEEVGRLAGGHSAASSRFPRFPLLRGCAHSQFPAEHYVRDGGAAATPLSEVAWRKRLQQPSAPADGPRNLNELEMIARQSADIGWFGVVHADGNSIGKLFMELGSLCVAASDGDGDAARSLHEAVLKDLSKGLHDATEKAVRAAEDAVGEDNVLRVVVGGDDITVVCSGRTAVEFARVFLEAFRIETSAVARRVRENHKVPISSNLTAAAGVVIVKPHFPFFVAYEMAEELTSATKSVVKALRPAGDLLSAFDVHVMADTSQSSLRAIRSGRRQGGTRFWGGPYAVDSDASSLRSASWLNTAITAAAAVDADGRRVFPRSAAMRLKAALYDDPQTAPQVASELLRRIPDAMLDEGGRLITDAGKGDSTAMVDVLDLVDIIAEVAR